MKLAFAGTPAFAASALQALLTCDEHSVELVLTQPDRPAGRGKKLQASPVKQLAQAHDVRVEQPPSLKDPASWAVLQEAAPEVLIVAAYGLILPVGLLQIPPLGGLNIHASLLPRWRGAAPIQRAIEAGDTRSGVCIMQMEAGLDTGPVWLQRDCPIEANLTGGQLHDRLAVLGAEALLQALPLIASGQAQPVPQGDDGVTYARKITPAERALDFREPAASLHNRIRAFCPAPGTSATLADRPETLKIGASRLAESGSHAAAEPGRIVSATAHEVVVACGQGSLLALTELQRPGAQRLPVGRFQQGRDALRTGDRFSLP